MQFTNSAVASIIIDRLTSILGVNEKGEVTLGFGTAFQTCIDILATCVGFSAVVVDLQRRAITHRAVIDAKKAGNFTAAAIVDNIEKGQKAYLRRPIRKFVLLTSASFPFSEKLKPIRLKDSFLTFTRQRPKNYPLPDGGSLIVKDNTPRDYCYIKVHISARDPYEGADLAFQRVDLLRAMWNLFFNLGSNVRITLGSSGHKPVNRILPGLFHTLHFPDGKLALEGQWWYTLPAKDPSAEHLDQHYDVVRRFERTIRKRLAGCDFSDRLIWFLIRYVRALDEPDLTTSFLRLWALLEELTGTLKASYDVTVRRASFVFDDSQYAKIVLGHLRDQRNLIVHKSSHLDDIERLTYELKGFVEALLKFMLGESSKFSNLDAVHSLLDLPSDPKLIRERIREHEIAYKLHRR